MGNVKKLKLLGFLSEMYFYTPIFTLYLLDYGVTLGNIILCQVLFSVAMLLAEVPTGYLADRYGQKASIMWCYLLSALSMGLLFAMPSLATLVIFNLVRGVSVAFQSGSEEALLYESHQDEKPKETYQQVLGKKLSNGILGFATATLITGILTQLYGQGSYKPLILVTAMTAALCLLITATLKDIRGDQEDPKEITFIKHASESFAFVKREHAVWALTLIALLTINGEYFIRQSYQPLFESAGVIPIFLGLALTLGSLLNFVIVRRAFLLEKYFTLDKILLIFNLGLVLGYGLLALVPNPYVVVGAYILLQGLFNAQRPIVSDYINERVQSSQRSTVLSTISFAQSFFSIIARLLLAASLGLFGLPRTLGFQAIYLFVGVLIGYWYLRRCGCVHRIKTHSEEQCIGDCPDAFGIAS